MARRPRRYHSAPAASAVGGSGPALSDAAPQKQGTATAGVSADASRADHVHPFRSRFMVGAWKVANLAASATSNMGFGGSTTGVDSQYCVMPRAGKVTHIVCDCVGAVGPSAGSFQVQIRVLTAAGVNTSYTAAGEILTVNTSSGPRSFVALATPVAFNAGDALGARCVSDASLSPITLDPCVMLMVEED
jgi:hypothetical protein